MVAAAGYRVFAYDTDVAAWAAAAAVQGRRILAKGGARRHGATWFVGVDALPNAGDGSLGAIALGGAWLKHVTPPVTWHAAQLSVVFPGYPQQDAGESAAAHRYRMLRDAAHVDGLLPEGPDRRRHLRDPHGFIAGLPLDDCRASLLVVWQGSHVIMRAAFAQAYDGLDAAAWGDVDITDIYHKARARVFDRCQRVPLRAKPGQVILLDRHLLHGVAPWCDDMAGDMRMMAYFRPLTPVADWL